MIRPRFSHVIFEPLNFISRLAALVPKPRMNLTRYHGVFAPNSQYRAWVTPARRGRGNKAKAPGAEDATPVASHAAMSWAQRLKRVFDIDIETCSVCAVKGRVWMTCVCRRVGRHRRMTCSAEICPLVNQHTYGCDSDRSGGMPSGRLGGIGLPKDTSGTGECGYSCEACGIGKEFVVRAE